MIAPLSARLRAIVLSQCGPAPLTCAFEPGGKLNGLGIPSPLWCRRCGSAETWHLVGQAAALAEKLEQSERLPFTEQARMHAADC